MRIMNTKIYGLEESVIASGYPTRYRKPDDLYVTLPSSDDAKRAHKLSNSSLGEGHDCFLKGVIVQFDLRYPLYLSKQLQRYHFIDFVSSQSSMRTLSVREGISEYCNRYVTDTIIKEVNKLFEDYKQSSKEDKHFYFMRLVSNLPSGFELWARMTTNYLQLKTIYKQRRSHKLEDWQQFCDWIEKLPKSEFITGVRDGNNKG